MNSNGRVLLALLGGVVAGTVLGILLAPDKGSETRKKIADAAKNFGDRTKEKVKEGMKMASGFKTKVNSEGEDIGI